MCGIVGCGVDKPRNLAKSVTSLRLSGECGAPLLFTAKTRRRKESQRRFSTDGRR